MRITNSVFSIFYYSWRPGYDHDERLEIAKSRGMIKFVQSTGTLDHALAKFSFERQTCQIGIKCFSNPIQMN